MSWLVYALVARVAPQPPRHRGSQAPAATWRRPRGVQEAAGTRPPAAPPAARLGGVCHACAANSPRYYSHPPPPPLPRSKYLLGNTHRVTVVMLPDGELSKKTEDQERARLEAAAAALGDKEVRGLAGYDYTGARCRGLASGLACAAPRSRPACHSRPQAVEQRPLVATEPPPQLERIIEETAALKERQETPDPPEALTCIPSLQLSDIPKTVTKVGGLRAYSSCKVV